MSLQKQITLQETDRARDNISRNEKGTGAGRKGSDLLFCIWNLDHLRIQMFRRPPEVEKHEHESKHFSFWTMTLVCIAWKKIIRAGSKLEKKGISL